MKAAMLLEAGSILIGEARKPEPRAGEVLLKVSMAGICGSDNALYHGKYDVSLPVIPGHEMIGHVAALGSGVTNLEVGQRVTVQPNFSCGECSLCMSGHGNICPEKIRLGIDCHGVFADYVTVPAAYTWPLPDDISDDDAVLAEPLAVAVHALRRGPCQKGDRVLVLGAGLIGLLTLQLAVQAGAEVTACDLEDGRLELARQLGATQVIRPGEYTGAGFDVVYETSGAAPGLTQAVQLAAPAAKIVVLGLPSKNSEIPAAMIVRKELDIVGSMIYTDEFPQTIKILQQRHLNLEPLRSIKFPLEQLNEQMGEFSRPDYIKMVVEI